MASPDFYASSPTVVLPSTQAAQYVGSHYSTFANGGANPFAPSTSANVSNQLDLTSSLAGRKRSRGDITAPDDDNEDASTPISIAQHIAGSTTDFNSDAPMTMNGPSEVTTSEALNSSSSESNAERATFSASHMKRPSMSSRKSQRTNISVSGQDNLAQLVLPSSMREATTEPLIDEATRVLGISWARMDSTEALRINQAAYQKWIQKYYPRLKDVSIWFENSAIPGYLVWAVDSYTAQQGWYIFSHDLTEARMVTTEASQLVPRLQMLPALHLAAPGGQIHAETDPVATPQDASHDVGRSLDQRLGQDNGTSLDEASHMLEHTGGCAAHTMELD